MHDLSETIVAVATAPGRGGVGCVRLSGPEAHAIARALFRRVRSTSGRIAFGRFVGRDGRAIDHGYLATFACGRSFTGEASAELWAHGSPPVLAELVSAACDRGARRADPGEFTYRAVRHGRIDLAEAEAIRGLVEARTLHQAKVAFAQAEGALSARLAPTRDRLEDLIARGEAAVEFVDEAETEMSSAALASGLDDVLRRCSELDRDVRRGRLLREGASVAIVGRPNAGKSTLFNRLLARERAIVTDVPGTTRDTLEETVDLDGLPVTLVDTAGLRSTADPIEADGVDRATRARRSADVVLWLFDGSAPIDREAIDALEAARDEGPPVLAVVNKCDLGVDTTSDDRLRETLRISALDGTGCDHLRDTLRETLDAGADAIEDALSTEARHAEALERCVAALERARSALAAGLTEECVLEDVRAARRALGSITGEFGIEDLYDRVFTTFCIGK